MATNASPVPEASMAACIARLIDRDPIMARQIKEHIDSRRLIACLELRNEDFERQLTLDAYASHLMRPPTPPKKTGPH